MRLGSRTIPIAVHALLVLCLAAKERNTFLRASKNVSVVASFCPECAIRRGARMSQFMTEGDTVIPRAHDSADTHRGEPLHPGGAGLAQRLEGPNFAEM